MPKIQTKTKAKKSTSVVESVPIESTLIHEITFYRGLAFLLMLLLVFIFFTFTALFAGMYGETRAMRLQFNRVYLQAVSEATEEVIEESGVVETLPTVVAPYEGFGLFFEYPSAWSHYAVPNKDEVHFFVSGAIVTELTSGRGELVVSKLDSNPYSNRDSEELSVGGLPSQSYKIVSSGAEYQVVIVSVPGAVYKLSFLTQSSGEVVLEPATIETILKSVIIK